MNNLLPTLNFDPGSGIFIGDTFGFILAVPISLFLAFWLSSVKNRMAVVFGALIGALIAWFAILCWVGTVIYNTPLPGADGASTFFGSLLACSVSGLALAILVDLWVARRSSYYYVREQTEGTAHE
jgi:biotin transporter BioY